MTQIGRSSRRTDIAVPGGIGGRVSLAWAAQTDRGYRRSVNEDSVLARTPIFSVADGMGGHEAGDIASAAVVNRLAERLDEPFVGPEAIVDSLRTAVADMAGTADIGELGMGTTVTGIALTTRGGTPFWLVFNIGDSRVYQLIDRQLDQLTVDHSLVQQLIDSGQLAAEDAEQHPHANVITRAVGFNEDPTPDFWLIPIVLGSRLLVCSDGLTKELTPHGIRHFLELGATPAEAATKLMDAALGNGGRDNVSVIVIDVLETPESGRQSTRASRAKRKAVA